MAKQPKESPALESPALEMPSAGGSYLRDPVTGALTKIEDDVPVTPSSTEQSKEGVSNV